MSSDEISHEAREAHEESYRFFVAVVTFVV
jgi:hypothetical protein